MKPFRCFTDIFRARRGTPTIPTPEDTLSASDNDNVGRIRRSNYGGYDKLWHLQEQDQQKWATLEPKLWVAIRNINSNSETVVYLAAFLIGPSLDKAKPTILCDSTEPGFAKKAVDQISRLRYLDELSNRATGDIKFELEVATRGRGTELVLIQRWTSARLTRLNNSILLWTGKQGKGQGLEYDMGCGWSSTQVMPMIWFERRMSDELVPKVITTSSRWRS